jgi:hypothetical protein
MKFIPNAQKLALLVWVGYVGSSSAWSSSVANSRPTVTLEVQSATNRDGSAVRIRTLLDESKSIRQVWIYFRKAGANRMQLISSHRSSTQLSSAAGLSMIDDWDKDGTHEITIIDECGAGPNCSSTLARIDPIEGRLITIFEGGGSHIKYQRGHLVEYSRNNCCSWTADVYPVTKDRHHVGHTPVFSAYTGLRMQDLDEMPKSATNKVPARHEHQIVLRGLDSGIQICYFYKEDRQGQHRQIPSPRGFENLCEFGIANR